MGQPITVSVRSGARPEVRFFTCNRSLTGMATLVYTAASGAEGERPPDVLARRLLARGARVVTVYSNVVAVEADPAAWPALEDQVRHDLEHLFEFYGAEAGWSFEARGVEPRPSPVP
jgi:hypothetical protein